MAAIPPFTSTTSEEASHAYCERVIRLSPWTAQRCQLSSDSFYSHGANMRIDCLPSVINAVSPTPYRYLPDELECRDQNAYDATAADYSSVGGHAFPGTQDYDSNCDHQADSIIDDCVAIPSLTEDFTQFEGPWGQEVPIHVTSQFHGGIDHLFTPYGTNMSLEPRFTPTVPNPTTFYEYSPTDIAPSPFLQPTTSQTTTEIHNAYVNVRRSHPLANTTSPTTTSPTGATGDEGHVLNTPQLDQEDAENRDALYPATRSCLCAWGCPSSPCGIHVTGDRKSLRIHLKQVHGFVSTGRESVKCKWDGCGRSLQKENVIRHILSHHMRLKVRCDLCGKDLCRRDVQTMHSKKFCPAKF